MVCGVCVMVMVVMVCVIVFDLMRCGRFHCVKEARSQPTAEVQKENASLIFNSEASLLFILVAKLSNMTLKFPLSFSFFFLGVVCDVCGGVEKTFIVSKKAGHSRSSK